MSKRSKACDISQATKKKVWKRDNEHCIICGKWVPVSCANAHFIPRSKSGLGIEQNILTLCFECHRDFDNSDKRKEYEVKFRKYLQKIYGENWKEEDLMYNKWKNFGKI